MSVNSQLISNFKKCIPKLTSSLRKGQNGRIGIIGGSKEYSGAPYFSSMSSLRVGADLSYVLTTQEASPIIKGYSPEMMVLPILNLPNSEKEIDNAIKRIHSLIIGPGLGRDEIAFKSVKTAFHLAKSQNIPVVIDADGLYILSFDISIVNGYEKCILTPNLIEFKRLYEASFGKEDEYDETSSKYFTLDSQCRAVEKLAQSLKNVTIIKKGKIDIISNGNQTVCNQNEGSLKRCGGIGDLLTGVIGTFSYWSDKDKEIEINAENLNPNICAAYCASLLIKECSKRSFNKFHRSMLAVDIIEEISSTFYEMFDKENY